VLGLLVGCTRLSSNALSLAEAVHQLLEDCDALGLEEDFIVVVGYFDVQMFAERLTFGLFGDTWHAVFVGCRHRGSWQETE
jgi:hypothetical protein